MFASKFWNFLLAIVIAVLAVIILLVPISVNESRLENTRSILQKDRGQLEALLKMEARARIDTTIVFAVNADVRKYLSMANRFKKDEKFSGEEQDTLLASLRKINEDLGPMGADILFVVDRKGKVVAQIGENERSSGYSLRGFPLVDSAIRGYLRDDTWIRDGKPYRMAARPVIHQGSYQGAIVHGKRMGEDLASLLSLATKTQAAIFVDGLVTESVLPPETKAPAAQKPVEGEEEEPKPVNPSDNDLNKCLGETVFKDEAFITKGRSGLLLCEGGGDTPDAGGIRFYVTALKFVGEARHGQAGVLIVRTVPPGVSLTGFVLDPERKAELAGEKGTLAIIGLVTFLLIVLGFLIVFFEGDRPKSKFLREVESMASREGERLNIYVFRGKYRKIADAINRAIDGAVEVLVSKATADAPSVSKILGPKDAGARLSKPQFEIPEQISIEDVAAPPPVGQSDPSLPSVPDDKVAPPAAKPAAKPPPPKAAPGKPPPPKGGAGKPPPPSAGEDPEARYKAIYKEFFDLKTACGESTDGLTYERFRATLKKQEDAIQERTSCAHVDFRVYVKEGKAALKATPVK